MCRCACAVCESNHLPILDLHVHSCSTLFYVRTRYACALCEGKLHLHVIETRGESTDDKPEEIYLPDGSVSDSDQVRVAFAFLVLI